MYMGLKSFIKYFIFIFYDYYIVTCEFYFLHKNKLDNNNLSRIQINFEFVQHLEVFEIMIRSLMHQQLLRKIFFMLS